MVLPRRSVGGSVYPSLSAMDAAPGIYRSAHRRRRGTMYRGRRLLIDARAADSCIDSAAPRLAPRPVSQDEADHK